MKNRNLLLTSFIIGAVAVTLGGCGGSDSDDHTGHDHSSDAHADTDVGTPVAADDSYPLKVCVVSGQELGSMGEPIVHNGTTVKFCCNSCIDDFNAEPEKFPAKLAAKP